MKRSSVILSEGGWVGVRRKDLNDKKRGLCDVLRILNY